MIRAFAFPTPHFLHGQMHSSYYTIENHEVINTLALPALHDNFIRIREVRHHFQKTKKKKKDLWELFFVFFSPF
jgi:hypothetical protein